MKPLRVLRWSLLALAGLALLGGGTVWLAIRKAEGRIGVHRDRARAEQDAQVRAARGRPPLLEPAVPGEASAVVSAFLDAVERVPSAERQRLRAHAIEEGDASPEAQDAVLEAHPEPLAALAPLLHVPMASRSPPVDLLELESRRLETRTSAGEWLLTACDRALATGRAADAATIAQRALGCAVTFAVSPTVPEQVQGLWLERRATRRLLAALAWAPPGREEVVGLRELFARIEGWRVPVDTLLDADRSQVRWMLTRWAIEGAFRGLAVRGNDEIGWGRLWSGKVYLADSLDQLDPVYESMRQALVAVDADAPAAVERGRAVAGDKAFTSWARIGIVFWPRWAQRYALMRAWNRVATAVLAVTEAAQRRGAAPTALADLVPEFLASVPIDPWSGKPLRYADGKVWSIGADRIDQEGSPPEDLDLDEDEGDLVATVPKVR